MPLESIKPQINEFRAKKIPFWVLKKKDNYAVVRHVEDNVFKNEYMKFRGKSLDRATFSSMIKDSREISTMIFHEQAFIMRVT